MYRWGLERKVVWEDELEMEGAAFVWTIRLDRDKILAFTSIQIRTHSSFKLTRPI